MNVNPYETIFLIKQVVPLTDGSSLKSWCIVYQRQNKGKMAMASAGHEFDGEGELSTYTSAAVNDPDLLGHSDIFFAAVGMTRMPMVVTNPNLPDNPIVFANEAFAEMTGYPMDEIINRNCRFLQGPDTPPELISQIRENIKNREHTSLEILNYRKDGTPFWNALFISPIYDKHNKLVYFFGSQLDVTRRRNAEQALHRSQKMEAIGQLTGGLAHDFNNLLTLILGNAKLLRKVVGNDDSMSKYLDRINDAALKGQKLTQQMLAFARKQQLEARPVDLNRVIKALNELLSKTLGSEIEIEIQLAPDLWITKVDAIQFELALINTLVNARDAVEGALKKRVTISTRNHFITAEKADESDDSVAGNYVEVSVKDTGKGMSPEVLERVTEPFFTTKDIGKGSGLGLSQVYGFTHQSNGFMQVESEAGSGTEIRLYFPQCDMKAEDTPPEVLRIDLNPTNTATVLLVDDNVQLLEMVKEVLEVSGYKIFEAQSGQPVVDLINGGVKFDVLFSDIAMPGGINGIKLAEFARYKMPNAKILLTTGYTNEFAQPNFKCDFQILPKPYDTDEILEILSTLLNQ